MKQNLLFCLLIAILVLPVTAQDNNAYLGALTIDITEASKRFHDLADTIAEDHYGWRPAEGIRSVVEVINHVSEGNFSMSQALGHESEYEGNNTDTKEGALARLAASQTHVQELLASLSETDLTGTVELFGMTVNHYRTLAMIAGHTHEHLGQLIAYARSNGIAPPWSDG